MKKNTNFFERLNEFMQSEGYKTMNDFALNGLKYKSSQKLNRLREEGTKPGYEILEDIANKFENVSLDWLITGKGEKVKAGADLVLRDQDRLYHAPMGKLPKKALPGAPVKFYDVDFAAGDIEFYDDDNSIKPAYTMDIPEFAGCTAFRNYGDSMEPLIKSSDILFSTQVNDWHDGLEYGQIYGIVRHDKRRHLKYIRKAKEKEESHFLLRSENADMYDDFLLAKDKIKSIWLIHGWINKRT